LKNFAAVQAWGPPEEAVFELRWKIARAVLSCVLLIFATMQITLTFHSETLSRALADHRRFVERNWGTLLWFFVLAGLHFYLLRVGIALVQRGLGEGTALGIIWGLLAPWLHGLVAAWLLASWVCFYKQADTGRTPQPEVVPEQGVLF